MGGTERLSAQAQMERAYERHSPRLAHDKGHGAMTNPKVPNRVSWAGRMAFCSQGQQGSPAFACEPLLPSQERSVLSIVGNRYSSVHLQVSVYKRSLSMSLNYLL
jgi:hypothetical protein